MRKDVSALPSSTTVSMANTPRIRLIMVDDDDVYREAAAEELSYLGFDVRPYASGEALLADKDAVLNADVVALDWKLPSGPGTELLRQLRERGVDLPIVFLSGVPATTYEADALDRGALDFVDKARGLAIFARRLRNVVGSSERENNHRTRQALRCGALDLHPELMRATWKGDDLDLTLTEFNIVYLLASQPGEYVSYRSVYDCVHHIGFIAGSGEHGFRTNVRSSIKRIRNKFRCVDSEFSDIENFAAVGYRWRRAGPARESDDQSE
jgi:two-component system response regulator ChvI